MDRLTLDSLFDGSGGFPLGGLLCGIAPVWVSEIEPFPIRVTTRRLPQMKHLGDVSAIHGGEIEPVDIITFGSPCTDMSIAGRRAGLDGRQSSLFYEAIRIIKEMRYATNGKYPRWACWENVTGAFSSNGGADFKAVLDALIGVAEPGASVPVPEKNRWPCADVYMGDKWSVAYSEEIEGLIEALAQQGFVAQTPALERANEEIPAEEAGGAPAPNKTAQTGDTLAVQISAADLSLEALNNLNNLLDRQGTAHLQGSRHGGTSGKRGCGTGILPLVQHGRYRRGSQILYAPDYRPLRHGPESETHFRQRKSR